MYRASMYYGRKGLPLTAISVIDLALWDLIGKLRNEPVYKMIGGSTRQFIDFYCTGPEPSHSKKNGFWGGKVPLPYSPEEGHEGLRKNVDFLRKHRESVGPDFPIMVDCYMSLNVTYTIDLVTACKELNINWWEECLSPDDSQGFAQIKRAHPGVKFTTGEHEYSRYGFRELIQGRNIDIIQPDVMWCGGLTELLKIANMAAAYDIPVVPHASGAYSYHFAAAMSKTVVPFCEYLANSPDGKSVMPVFGDLFVDEVMPTVGKLDMKLLEKPGFGLELNRKATLIDAKTLLMPNPEHSLGNGDHTQVRKDKNDTSQTQSRDGKRIAPIFQDKPATEEPDWVKKDTAPKVQTSAEVTAQKARSMAQQGMSESGEKRERRQSAMSVEEARDDTNATIKVMRMRDRGNH